MELKSRNGGLHTRDSLEELAELATTAGGEVVGDGIQKLDAPNPGTFIGKGKADEFAAHCRQHDIDTVADLQGAEAQLLEPEHA